MRLRWRRRRDLSERLRPYLPDRITPEPMVDADPIRMFLYRWMIETGDPIEVVAQGFDLSTEEVARLGDRTDGRISLGRAESLAHSLGFRSWSEMTRL